jgi:Methyltransferase domain
VTSPRRRPASDPLADPDVPSGMSLALLQELHLLTRDGQLNQDARRKLKQIRHFVGLLGPALDDVYARHAEPSIVDCGAGKSYLGFLLYELIIGPRGRGQLCAVEVRAELVAAAQARARRFGHQRFRFAAAEIGALAPTPAATSASSEATSEAMLAGRDPREVIAASAAASAEPAGLPERLHIVTALHACDTASDDAIALALRHRADYVAVVPCCQAEVARQLKAPAPDDPATTARGYPPRSRAPRRGPRRRCA